MPTPSYARRGLLLLGALTCAGIGAAALAPPWLPAARILAGTLDAVPDGVPSMLLRRPREVIEADEAVAELRSRRYAPGDAARTVHAVLFPGAHPLGIDEPRLRRLAGALAGEGLTVHAIELPALRALQLDPSTVAQMTAAIVATSRRAGGARVAAFGISVTGGLLLQAATAADAMRALSCVVAVGAHHDLRTVARAYAAPAQPARPTLDPYGARVLVSAFADALLPPDDVGAARTVIHDYVSERYAQARAGLARLSPAGRARIAALLDHPREAVPASMNQLLVTRGSALAELSPAGKLGRLRVPVFLLHGQHDPIVPSSETTALAAELDAHRTHVLITPLLRHAEGTPAPVTRDVLRLVGFMADVLRSAQE